jgi:hypothetical protein
MSTPPAVPTPPVKDSNINSDDAMFTVPVSSLVGKEYIPLVDDVVRMVCIQCTIQLMIFLGGGAAFFTSDFVLLVIYVVLGVMLYWLVVRKAVAFR